MDDDTLDRTLSELRSRLDMMCPARAVRSRDCLTFGRAREIALDALRRTAGESAHLEACRRCSKILASFEASPLHLPFWMLLRRRLGLLTSAEQRDVEYHLESGGCRVCRERWVLVNRGAFPWLQLDSLLPLPHATAVQASVPGPEVLARSQNEELEAELVLDHGDLSLEVRTRQTALTHTLIAFSFQDAAGEALMEGFVVLGPDVDGWVSAEVRIDSERYRLQVMGRCAGLIIASLESGALSESEWQGLLAAAPVSSTDPHIRAAWGAWARRNLSAASSLPKAATPVLQELAEQFR